MSKDEKRDSTDGADEKSQQNDFTELNEYKQQIQQLTEALMRERADSENIRRRHDDQLANVKNHVKTDIIKDLLPVIDNFDRSLKHVPKDIENNDYIKGVQGIVKQFENILISLGVQRIKTVGEVFNPELHEAVSMEEGDGDVEVVSEELQSGYILGDTVIRHAMVRVKPSVQDK
mgnify:CR=1 FL=1